MGGRDFEVRTADGRTLLARVVGPQEGELLLCHAGTPGSRFLFDRHVEEGAGRGLRQVSYSRPGYEGSDRVAGRDFAHCAADSAAVADALGAETFHVVGTSGGGPHALACAALLPRRVASAAVIGSFAPRRGREAEWMKGTGRGNEEEFAALEGGEAALAKHLEKLADGMAGIETVDQLLDDPDGFLCPADRACLGGPGADPRWADYQVLSQAHAVRGGIWGWLDDDLAMYGEWGFDPAAIEVPVSVWHGREDRIVPVGEGEWLAANIPAARAHLIPGEGHLSIFLHHYAPMLDELLAARA